MKISKITLKLNKKTERHLRELSRLTGISIDGIITGILWDYILKDRDNKKWVENGSK